MKINIMKFNTIKIKVNIMQINIMKIAMKINIMKIYIKINIMNINLIIMNIKKVGKIKIKTKIESIMMINFKKIKDLIIKNIMMINPMTIQIMIELIIILI